MSQSLNNLKHVAIIMDGNGRWAEARSHERVWGHIRGSSVVSNIVEEADECGVKALTLYTFSTENWSRPQIEISTLFSLLKKFLIKEKKRILKNKIKFRVMGDISSLGHETQELIKNLEHESRDMPGLKLTFAFGYGGRGEIVQGINDYLKKHPNKEITEAEFSNYMLLPDLGDVDLLIRTGGDQRISNFLLWQAAYAELYFTKTQWPNFTPLEFRTIYNEVANRERRFGGIMQKNDLSRVESQGIF